MKNWEYQFTLIEGHPLFPTVDPFFVRVADWPVRPQVNDFLTIPGFCGTIQRIEFDWETATIKVLMK